MATDLVFFNKPNRKTLNLSPFTLTVLLAFFIAINLFVRLSTGSADAEVSKYSTLDLVVRHLVAFIALSVFFYFDRYRVISAGILLIFFWFALVNLLISLIPFNFDPLLAAFTIWQFAAAGVFTYRATEIKINEVKNQDKND